MGTCQSKRDLPRDSLYVMIGVTNDAEFREWWGQEDELPSGDGMYRPSALNEFLDAMEGQGSGKIKIIKRATMDTLCSSIRSMPSTTLVEPTPQVPECRLASAKAKNKSPMEASGNARTNYQNNVSTNGGRSPFQNTRAAKTA